MLWISLYLPDLALQVFQRGIETAPPMAVVSNSHRPEVLACNKRARAKGVAVGMSIAAALALLPDIELRPREAHSETQAIGCLALWAGQFTPTISLTREGLLLEVESCLNYFHGLDTLLAKISHDLVGLGWQANMASAPTPGGAALLARSGLPVHARNARALNKHLQHIPVSLLESATACLDILHGLGIRTLADLEQLPADGVARRFGQALTDELRRAQGLLPDPRPLFVPPAHYANRIELPAPVIATEPLLFVARRLIVELTGFLRARGAGVSRLTLRLVYEESPATEIDLKLSPTRLVEHIMRVLRERLARERLPDRVEAVGLESREIVPLESMEGELFPVRRTGQETLQQLVERLGARLGTDAVHAIYTHPDHRPELAWRANAPGGAVPAYTQTPVPRPVWLLAAPRRLPGGLAGHSLMLVIGPERIESGWWDGDDIGRDYFVARNSEGGSCWIFRDRSGDWYLHGIFA
jgi:protein ImuB